MGLVIKSILANFEFFLLKRVIIKSLQCHLKLKNENGTPKPCKLLKGAAHGKMSRRPTITPHPANNKKIITHIIL